MRLTVVGCSGSFAGPDSAASCYLLESEHEGRTWRVLLDLGSGALGPLQTHVDPTTLDAVLVSHLHPDHYFDLSGLYVLWRYHPGGPRRPIPVWGPKGVAKQSARAYGLRKDPGMSGEFDFHEYDDEPVRVGPFTVHVARVAHPVAAYALRVEAGGAALVYSGDTGPCQPLVDLAAGADLFVCEAAFLESGDNPADLHLTGKQAGAAAAEAGRRPSRADPRAALARQGRRPRRGPGGLRRPPRAGPPRRHLRRLTPMPTFTANDGTTLSYRESGHGRPLVCLPGGPMQDAAYLGELGGLSQHVRLVLLDPRGTGGSDVPAAPATYRCDRQVDDVEALREHLGLERMDLLGHSAGANLAELYVARHPDRVARLVLVTPSVRALALEATAEQRWELVRLRVGEPWYDEAERAFGAVSAGTATDDDWDAITPFMYGRWDDAARAHFEAGNEHRNDDAAAVFGEDGVFDPEATSAALTAFTAPVLLVAGEVDVATPPTLVAQVAALFRDATLVVQPGAGHSPWLDDPERFVALVAPFLG